jgi:ubiquitin carboxyl-terminal hydrolase 5/13
MPDLLDLKMLRGHGLQPDEELLPETTAAPPSIVFDQALLSQLAEIGFPIQACKRALYFTENRGLEPATQWLMEHISDPEFTSPFVPPGMFAKSGKIIINY